MSLIVIIYGKLYQNISNIFNIFSFIALDLKINLGKKNWEQTWT